MVAAVWVGLWMGAGEMRHRDGEERVASRSKRAVGGARERAVGRLRVEGKGSRELGHWSTLSQGCTLQKR